MEILLFLLPSTHHLLLIICQRVDLIYSVNWFDHFMRFPYQAVNQTIRTRIWKGVHVGVHSLSGPVQNSNLGCVFVILFCFLGRLGQLFSAAWLLIRISRGYATALTGCRNGLVRVSYFCNPNCGRSICSGESIFVRLLLSIKLESWT